MGIEPDTKDWTWVLERACPDCGFDSAVVSFAAVPGMIRENAAQWVTVLQRPDVVARPMPDKWSDLEYACHVRDVFELFHERLQLMLGEDAPRFANWDQDETAVTDRYNEQEPTRVSDELVAAAATISATFESVSAAQLGRTGTRSDGASFTIESFARYLIHDPVHHLWDVGGAP